MKVPCLSSIQGLPAGELLLKSCLYKQPHYFSIRISQWNMIFMFGVAKVMQ